MDSGHEDQQPNTCEGVTVPPVGCPELVQREDGSGKRSRRDVTFASVEYPVFILLSYHTYI